MNARGAIVWVADGWRGLWVAFRQIFGPRYAPLNLAVGVVVVAAALASVLAIVYR